mmetsp:Transcript_92343/g.257237  ORF Transcript_92343/g.257237 Transcript_92343/m.257237 type:complete len:226 (-) Transcript_92343:988-1665(-)
MDALLLLSRRQSRLRRQRWRKSAAWQRRPWCKVRSMAGCWRQSRRCGAGSGRMLRASASAPGKPSSRAQPTAASLRQSRRFVPCGTQLLRRRCRICHSPSSASGRAARSTARRWTAASTPCCWPSARAGRQPRRRTSGSRRGRPSTPRLWMDAWRLCGPCSKGAVRRPRPQRTPPPQRRWRHPTRPSRQLQAQSCPVGPCACSAMQASTPSGGPRARLGTTSPCH